MAKLIRLSDTSWKQPFQDRGKQFKLWLSQKDVATYCNIEDGQKRHLRIKFEDKFKIDVTDYFSITSGREVSFPPEFQNKIKPVVLNNKDSFFIVEVLD